MTMECFPFLRVIVPRLRGFEMLADAANYGPFAPVVGYAGAIVATAAALLFLFAGKLEKWRPPDEDLPGGIQALVVLLCGVGMVIIWYCAEPDVMVWLLSGTGVLAIASVVCFLRYNRLLGIHIYIKRVAVSANATRDVRILGGPKLLPDAERKRKQEGIDTQTLFEGAAYNPDLLWSRPERQWVKQRVLVYFLLALVLGTCALTAASFATQVRLTKKPAASIIRTTDAPGLQKK
jgi:hypothetical protein